MSERFGDLSGNPSHSEHSKVPVALLAWMEFRALRGSVSVDRMVCDPVLRNGFLNILWRMEPKMAEQKALWSLMTARKNKVLRRFLAG